LQQILKLLDEGVRKEDFEKLVKGVLDLVVKIEKKNSEAVDRIEQLYKTLTSKIQNDSSENFKTLKGQVDELFVGEQLKGMKDENDKMIKQVQDKLARVKDGKTPTINELLNLIKPLIPKPVKGDRGEPADIENVKKLKKEIEELKDDIKKFGIKTVYIGGGNSSGGRIVKSYDLSSSLNGVLKTFSLPAFWRIISVHSSSFPNALRETIDYTSNASAMTITLTGQIDASTTLAAGQTLIVVFSEA
jgi:gas vesicle protein